jgi:outer membrane protein assembly factor BamB
MNSIRLLLAMAVILAALSLTACKEKQGESVAAPTKPFTEWTKDLGIAAVPQTLMDGSGNWYVPASITGLDLKKALWERDVSTMGMTRYAAASGRVFYIGSKGYIGALDAATGQTVWEDTPKVGLEGGSSTPTGLVVTKHCLVISTSLPRGSSELRFFKPGTGELLRTELLDYEVAQMVASGGRVFALSSSGEITSFSETDGTRIAAARQVTQLQDIAVSGERLVLYGREMAAFSLDTSTLKPLGARMFKERMSSLFAMGGELLLFNVDKPEMVALDPQTLEVNWQKPLENQVNMLPAGFGSRIFLGEETGKMRCFDIASGKYTWTRGLEASCYVFMVFENCVLAVADFPPQNQQQQFGQRQQPMTPPKPPSWYKGGGTHSYCLFILNTSDGSTIGQFVGDGYLMPQCVTDDGIVVREDPEGTLACYPYRLQSNSAVVEGSAK